MRCNENSCSPASNHDFINKPRASWRRRKSVSHSNFFNNLTMYLHTDIIVITIYCKTRQISAHVTTALINRENMDGCLNTRYSQFIIFLPYGYPSHDKVYIPETKSHTADMHNSKHHSHGSRAGIEGLQERSTWPGLSRHERCSDLLIANHVTDQNQISKIFIFELFLYKMQPPASQQWGIYSLILLVL